MKPFVVSISEYIWLYIMKLLGYTAKTSVSGERHCWNLTKSRNSQFWEGEWGRESTGKGISENTVSTLFQHYFTCDTTSSVFHTRLTARYLAPLFIPHFKDALTPSWKWHLRFLSNAWRKQNPDTSGLDMTSGIPPHTLWLTHNFLKLWITPLSHSPTHFWPWYGVRQRPHTLWLTHDFS